jgi:exopolysaccharide biosynthesis polyprenyl glycosylphosphotransferase
MSPPFETDAASVSAGMRSEAARVTASHVPVTASAAGVTAPVVRIAAKPMPELAASSPRVVARRYSTRDRAVRRLLVLADAHAIALALVIAFAGQPGMWSFLAWGLLVVPLCLVIYNAYGLYDGDIKRISQSTVDDLPGLAHALLLGCLLLWLYYHVVPTGTIHFKHILLFGLLALVSTLALRTVARRTIRRRLGPERVLLVGDDAEMLAGKLRSHPEYGVKPVGLVQASTRANTGVRAFSSVRRLGHIDELNIDAVVAEHRIHRVIVSHGDVGAEDCLELVRRAQELGVKVAVVPQPFGAMGPSVEVDNVEGVIVFGMHPPVLGRSSRAIKRGMDVVGSLVLLLASAPLLAATACAIKLDSPGPVFFRQQRVGRGGRRFFVLKFRTMVDDADQMVDRLRAESRDPNWLLLDSDPRVTRVGRILRRASLDELPQAWNVLKGEMSLVGPRPLVESEDREIRGWARCRVDLTPGMTGLWQVLGRTSIPFSEMVRLDSLYVTNWSLWRDIKLLLSTVPVLLSRRGAN